VNSDFLYNFCPETFLILRRTERGVIKKIVYRFSCKAPVITNVQCAYRSDIMCSVCTGLT